MNVFFHPKKQSGYIHIGLLTVAFILTAFLISTQIQTTTSYPNRPEQVLGASNSTDNSNSLLTKDQLEQELLSSQEVDHISNYTISGQNNQIYTFTGTKTYSILKLIPIPSTIEVSISAESGNLLTKQQSLFSQVLETVFK